MDDGGVGALQVGVAAAEHGVVVDVLVAAPEVRAARAK